MREFIYSSPKDAYREAQRRIQEAKDESRDELDLIGLGLMAVPFEIRQLTKLQFLWLHSNRLTIVPSGIWQLTNLQKIRLDRNQLTTIPPEITKLVNLRELKLWDNQLTSVPPEIAQLTNLREIWLQDNRLTVVPEWLVQMPLEKLYIGYNPITQPPPEQMWEALTERYMPVDLEAVRRYYIQLEREGEAYFYEAKFLLIGEGGAGKTSLARKLLDPKAPLPTAKESTEGIDVLQWNFPVPQEYQPSPERLSHVEGKGRDGTPRSDSDKLSLRYTANIWDFGGQSIYHATHQFFLSKRSVYVLLTDTRRQHTDFYDWLQMQEAFGENSPILLLKNQNRQHGNQCVIENLPHLRERFPNLQEIVEVDLSNVPHEKNWETLLTHLQDHLLALDHIRVPRPKTWVKVRKAIDNSKHDQISRRQFFDLCRSCGIDDKADALQLSDYLHHIGDILHFEADPILKDLIILNPTWALDAVYRVLDNEEILANWGQFSRQQLRILWHEAKYDHHHEQLLRLMQNFQLCYPLPDSPDDFIAPQLLQPDASDDNWEAHDDDLHLRYRYPRFMPRGILSRAIAALHEYIEEPHLVWRSGVILNDGHARARLLELRGEKEIRILVGGKRRRDLLMEIIRTLDKLHQGFSSKLNYEKMVPCRCERCLQSGTEPHFFDIEELNGYRDEGLQMIRCGKRPFNEIDVLALVDDAILQMDRRGGDLHTHHHYGDDFKIGSISDSQDVAIGREASASTTQS